MKFSLFPLLMLVFLFFPFFALAEESYIKINEIAWMGTSASYNNEWLELKNIKEKKIDISGWRIVSGDGSPDIKLSGTIQSGGLFLLERTDDNSVINKEMDQVYTGSLNNSGEILEVITSAEQVVDKIEAGDGWPAGDNDTKQTMINCDGKWISSSDSEGSPKQDNVCHKATTNNKQKDKTDSKAQPGEKKYKKGDLLINEFVSAPEKGKQEWVEIKNYSEKKINIKGWYLQEGNGSRTKLPSKSVSGGDFQVIKEIKGYLNNKGDKITLKDKNGDVIDELIYGKWKNKKGEVLSPPSSSAVARNNQKQLKITSIPTAGEENIINNRRQEPQQSKNVSEKLIITEIFPNPQGDDKGEFLEIYNKSEQEVNLKGWKIINGLGQVLKFDKPFIKALNIKTNKVSPQTHFVLYKNNNKLTLNNNSGSIRFFSPHSSGPVQILDYDKADPGKSYVDTDHINTACMSSSTLKFFKFSSKAGEWVWSMSPTPGGFNQVRIKNQAPHPIFSFFGKKEPKESISFDASDTFDENGDNLYYHWDFGDGVVVEGIKNPTHIYLDPGIYQIKLTVSDKQKSSDLTKEIIIGDISRKHQETSPNFSQDNQNIDKPGNISHEHQEISSNSSQDNQNIDKPSTEAVNISSADKHVSTTKKHYLKVSLSEAKIAPSQTFVKTEGEVIVRPGVLGQQYFYIFGSPGLQIYNYYKDFPTLNLGDRIEVKGEISESRHGEKRIKTETAQDIKVLTHDSGLPEVQKIKCASLNQDKVGGLVKITGEVVDKDNKKINIQDDSGKVLIYLQENIKDSKKEFKVGKKLAVIGVASKFNNKIRVMPRSGKDINFIDEVGKTQVLGTSSASSSNSSWTLPSDNSSKYFWKYLCITLGAALVVSSVLLFRKVKS